MKQTGMTVKESTLLMDFLILKFPEKSRTSVKAMLKNKQICVNGKPETQFNLQLNVGDNVTLNRGKVNYELRNSKLKIVYEDDYIIVVEKSEGLLAVATNVNQRETTAFNILSDYLKKKDPRNRLFVVHRIDRETSGLLMYAKSREVQLAIQEKWHENVTDRIYLAVVEGAVEKEEDTIVSYLHESKAYKIHSSINDDGGQKAVTHYRVVRRTENYSMLKVKLDTGRKNQIRVHMQEIGHPIIGDKKYGASNSPIGRVGLHAKVLGFIHPVTKENLRFETPVPRKFNALFIQEEQKEKELQKAKKR